MYSIPACGSHQRGDACPPTSRSKGEMIRETWRAAESTRLRGSDNEEMSRWDRNCSRPHPEGQPLSRGTTARVTGIVSNCKHLEDRGQSVPLRQASVGLQEGHGHR